MLCQPKEERPMADKSETDTDSSNKPKFNLFLIGLFSFLGLFFIGLIVALVMILRMPTTVSLNDATATESKQLAGQDKVLVKPEAESAVKTTANAKSETPSEKGEKKKTGEANKPQFYKLRPVMVVNIPAADRTRYLQVDVELMTRSSSGVENIETYSPIIRNDLIILFSTQRYEDLLTLEGKENLRKKALETVQKVMKQNAGDATVDQVLFTNFVAQ